MKPAVYIGLGTLVLLSGSTSALAQRGMTRASSTTPVRHVAPASPGMVRTRAHFRQAQAVTRTNSVVTTPNVVVVGGTSPIRLKDLLNPVPGFGFDFVHLAAMNRDLGVRALIDPVTQMQLAQAERLLRETPSVPSVFPIFGGYGGYGGEEPMIAPQQPQQAPPQIIILQQPVPVVQAAAAPTAAQQATAAPAPAPVPEVGEFVLVQRDGSQLLAVAFTRQADRIVYITREGLRRSLPVADLDASATSRANEQRGTSLLLPL